MADHILLILFLVIASVVGLLSGVLGRKWFPGFSALYGLICGAIIVFMGAYFITDNWTGIPFIIAAAVVGIALAVGSTMVPRLGMVLGGLAVGSVVGSIGTRALDIMLNYAIPEVLYTVICVVIALIFALLCLLLKRVGDVIATAFTGGFLMVGGIGLLITYLLSDTSAIALPGGLVANIAARATWLVGTISTTKQMIYIAVSLLVGGVFMFVQLKMLVSDDRADARGYLEDGDEYDDEYDDYIEEDYDEGYEDDYVDEQPAFARQKKRRGLFGRKTDEEWEDEEEYYDDADDLPAPKPVFSRNRRTDFDDEFEDDYEEDYDDMPPARQMPRADDFDDDAYANSALGRAARERSGAGVTTPASAAPPAPAPAAPPQAATTDTVVFTRVTRSQEQPQRQRPAAAADMPQYRPTRSQEAMPREEEGSGKLPPRPRMSRRNR
ncbi:TMEM198/TM7SF3 family protein [Eubacteriales bacterium OttesenSCG-928-N14]|nr:TMEM198/TM7SF3 family protein [Eubacteriales bacterium OttesenSCG-928-N14]